MLVGQRVMNIHASRVASHDSMHAPAVDFSSKQSGVSLEETILGVKMLLLTRFSMKAWPGTMCHAEILDRG